MGGVTEPNGPDDSGPSIVEKSFDDYEDFLVMDRRDEGS